MSDRNSPPGTGYGESSSHSLHSKGLLNKATSNNFLGFGVGRFFSTAKLSTLVNEGEGFPLKGMLDV